MKVAVLLSLFALVLSFNNASATEKVETKQELMTYQVRDYQYSSSRALSLAIQEVVLDELYSKTAEEHGVTYKNCLHVGDIVESVKSVLAGGMLNCSQMPNGFNCDPKITMSVNLLCDVTYYQ